jgi:DNA-directed RNA polymerase specialized sigma24 family protein
MRFHDYHPELLGMLYHLVGNIEDARDALQDTFIKCWKHREQVAGLDNLKAWIFRIALNTGRDVRQTAWRRRKRSLPEDRRHSSRDRRDQETKWSIANNWL